MLRSLLLLSLLLPLSASARPAETAAVSCAAYCFYTVGEKGNSKFMAEDGPTYGKTLQALYEKCDKLDGRLREFDSTEPVSGLERVVNMQSACRENPRR